MIGYNDTKINEKKIKKRREPTASNTGLLLLTSSTPTMTRAEEDRGCGPPDALSSVAVTFKTYSRP